MILSELKKLDYHPLVREQIEILDEVLRELEVPGMFENKEICFDEFLRFESYLKFNLPQTRSNTVELDFHLMQDGMRIDFQDYSEALEFSETDILERRSKVRDTILPLLSEPILVEYKGNSRYVNLFNRDGSRFAIWSLGSIATMITGGYWKSQSIDQHLFDPIYPGKDSKI